MAGSFYQAPPPPFPSGVNHWPLTLLIRAQSIVNHAKGISAIVCRLGNQSDTPGKAPVSRDIFSASRSVLFCRGKRREFLFTFRETESFPRKKRRVFEKTKKRCHSSKVACNASRGREKSLFRRDKAIFPDMSINSRKCIANLLLTRAHYI